jgi:hypothetical protein
LIRFGLSGKTCTVPQSEPRVFFPPALGWEKTEGGEDIAGISERACHPLNYIVRFLVEILRKTDEENLMKKMAGNRLIRCAKAGDSGNVPEWE